jgi:hydrogenase-4 component B
MTGGLAIACFAKAYGITFLGLFRDENKKYIKEVNLLMRISMILMSLVVISLMIFTPTYIKYFDKAIFEFNHISIYSQIFPTYFNMHSIGINGGVVSPIILLIALAFVILLLLIFYKISNVKVRIHNSWACGYKVNPKTQYSATGFAGPIRRFFSWLYKPNEHFKKQIIYNHQTKFSHSSYEVHIKPLFEQSLYDNFVKILKIISFYIYKLAHFEKTRYSAMIFNLLLVVLFSYRIYLDGVSFFNILLEVIVITIFIKILIIGDKK